MISIFLDAGFVNPCQHDILIHRGKGIFLPKRGVYNGKTVDAKRPLLYNHTISH